MMKGFKRYEKYKDSGVEWLGEIPEHWNIKKIKYTTYVKGRIGWQGLRADEFIDEGPYLVTGTDFINGKINWNTCYHISLERYNEAPEIQLKENDLLITKDGSIGKIALVRDIPDKAILNSGIFVTRPINNSYTVGYMYWVLNSCVFSRYIDYTKTGSTINHLYQATFEDFLYTAPPIIEQKIIANFLDQKTVAIDSLIADKEKLIALLQEKRQAIISQAVTKGLDPNVPMKDSGIEWLGEIPEHWEVKRLKYVSMKIQTGTTPPTQIEEYYNDCSVNWYGPSSFSREINIGKPAKLISMKAVKDGKARLFPAGTIFIVTIGATIGKVGYLESIGSCNQQITAIVTKKNINSKYIAYQMKTQEMFIRGIAPNTTLPILDQQKIGTLKLIIPPYNEQKDIVNYIDESSSRIVNLITEITFQIEKLKELRQFLITAAVTGKIDVRDYDITKDNIEKELEEQEEEVS